MKTFKNEGLSNEILKAITELGFETPTPIQEKTIPAIISSTEDIIALAQTGTGKTAGFGLPILQMIEPDLRKVQALVLCPTRELCLQISKDLTNYSKYIDNLSVVPIYGGTSIVPQMKQLRDGAQIVVGTPGRTLDVINRGALKIDHIRWLVLDEADEMLNMGFKEDLDSILSTTPDDKQTLLFSATMPDGVKQIARKYMHGAEEISVGKRNQGADTVKHEFYMVRASDRYLALKRIADINPDVYGIVFCRTRMETKEVADKLIQDGYNADALHGDLSQAQRDMVMSRFRSKNLQLLIATDVAARGLDVNDLTHVINYNLPDDPEIYIHRSGRTGRAGKTGICITIIHSREARKIKDLERLVGKPFDHKQVPSGKEICEKRLFSIIDKLENVEVDESAIASFMPLALKKLSAIDRENLIKRIVWVEFNQFIEYYKGTKDLNVSQDDYKDERLKKSRKEYVRFHINLGTKQNLNASYLIGLINDLTGNKSIDIGKIEILRKFSFFEVEKDFEKIVKQSFDGVIYEDTPVTIQPSAPDPAAQRGGNYNRDRQDFRRDKKDFGRSNGNDRGNAGRKRPYSDKPDFVQNKSRSYSDKPDFGQGNNRSFDKKKKKY
jgi:ATP-dependent RNA helicase DeaD